MAKPSSPLVKRIIIGVVLLAIVGGFGAWYVRSNQTTAPTFRTVTVDRGDLRATISATGTIEPQEVIDVGAQVSGPIISLGTDPRLQPIGQDAQGSTIYRGIDYSSPVKVGTVLAQIDPMVYQSQVDNFQAQLDSANAAKESADAQVAVAEANLKKSNADLLRMHAMLNSSQRDWDRATRLKPSGAVTDLDYDTAQATYLTNKSALAVGEATVTQNQAALKDAKANVTKSIAAIGAAKAALKQAQVNLGYCTIKSPVDGVIIDRRVTVGQTVVSALSASSLFLLAKDLTKMQVWASVNEADIGNIHSGQDVTFTVDAHPGRTFTGTVAPDQPRLNASMNQNVVTYTAVVNTDNKDLSLKPYMTANLSFIVNKRSNVLLLPNATLRYKPRPELVVPEDRDSYISSQRMRQAKSDNGGQSHPGDAAQNAAPKKKKHNATLWVRDGDFLRPIKVVTGLTDGISTEIVSGDIKEGDQVVTNEIKGQGAKGETNPFTPNFHSNNSNSNKKS